MKQIVISSAEPLIFRDGRPFGDFGTVDGGVLRWPLPSTIAGMVRTRIGNSRGPDFFGSKDPAAKKNNIDAILKISVQWTLPVWRPQGGHWRYLFPRPADALLINHLEKPDLLTLHHFTLRHGEATFGHDLPWKNWLLPVTEERQKPAADAPDLWHQETFLKWLMLEPQHEKYAPRELGFSWPKVETRMHSCIDPKTGTVLKSQLFSSSGIRLEIPPVTPKTPLSGAVDESGRFGIAVAISGHQNTDDPCGVCLLGGERRTAFADPLPTPFPTCPTGFDGQRFLRLVLITPGDFGGWSPDWLRPPPKGDETPWCVVPGTDITVRLVAAHVPRWQGISGWDYAERAPKATRKLTPAGTVYIIEVSSPERSQELAQLLWGRSIAQGLHHLDGYGVVCIGKTNLS